MGRLGCGGSRECCRRARGEADSCAPMLMEAACKPLRPAPLHPPRARPPSSATAHSASQRARSTPPTSHPAWRSMRRSAPSGWGPSVHACLGGAATESVSFSSWGLPTQTSRIKERDHDAPKPPRCYALPLPPAPWVGKGKGAGCTCRCSTEEGHGLRNRRKDSTWRDSAGDERNTRGEGRGGERWGRETMYETEIVRRLLLDPLHPHRTTPTPPPRITCALPDVSASDFRDVVDARTPGTVYVLRSES